MDIHNLFDVTEKLRLDANESMVFLNVITRLNKSFWRPVAVKQDVAGRGMRRKTFFAARQRLVDMGALIYRPGLWKTAPPVYRLGPRFDINNSAKTEKDMRNRENIRKLLVEIDHEYPDFSGFCARYKWDKAVEFFKAEHPELAAQEWPVDSIGDPVNREQAHEMMVELHRRKKKRPAVKVDRQATSPEAWSPFYLFVDMWRLSYPKKANRATIINAVKDLTKGKEQWPPEQVKALQDTITGHTAAYVASFGGDYTYMVSPVNYFAAEKWTEKVSVKQHKYDKTDVHQKMAGAHVVPNMPKITTIRVN